MQFSASGGLSRFLASIFAFCSGRFQKMVRSPVNRCGPANGPDTRRGQPVVRPANRFSSAHQYARRDKSAAVLSAPEDRWRVRPGAQRRSFNP